MTRRMRQGERLASAAVCVFALNALAFGAPATANCGANAQTDGAADIVAKVRANVERFVEQFSYLRYDEDVVQEKLNGREKIAYKQETIFDSIIRVRYDESTLRVDEQRIPERSPKRIERRPLLETYGFSTLAMVFHPYYESSFHFSRLDDESIGGRSFACIHFEHIPGRSTPVLYQMLGADKPLELAGKAWVDPVSGEIHQIEAALSVATKDLALKEIRAEVAYKPVMLQDETTPLLLPAIATIDLETPRQHWRNIHHFSDYRKYRVTMNMPGASAQ